MIIYKKDTKGKIRYLNVYTTGPDLVQESGIIGTDSPVKHIKTCKSKNVGRSNQTTPEDQAHQEMLSLLASKQSEGYFSSIEEAQKGDVILPMLAKDYKTESKKVDWKGHVFIQPKLDGMRCLTFIKEGEVILMSRDGKEIEHMDHIRSALKNLKLGVILDGELYCHGRSFQENMKLIKKHRPGESEQVKYHIYDIVENKPFYERVIQSNRVFSDPLIKVESYQIKNKDELESYHSKFISEGYEGSIIRHGDEPYKINGRSSNLLKYKDFIDIACKIVNIEPAEQRPEHGVPVLEHEGKQFRAGMKYSHDERKEFLENKNSYIGKTAEIRFFEYTDEGIPRFPVMVGIRLDK